MRPLYVGDSYDIVKQSLLRWLAPMGSWAVHPMFTVTVTDAEAAAYSRFLGCELVSTEELNKDSNRNQYLASARGWSGNLFLDPDTGLRPKLIGGKKAPAYLFVSELQEIVCARPGTLTMVYDQSFTRGGAREALKRKMDVLSEQGVASLAYWSQACFLIASDSGERVDGAHRAIMDESRLPEDRIIVGPRANGKPLIYGPAQTF